MTSAGGNNGTFEAGKGVLRVSFKHRWRVIMQLCRWAGVVNKAHCGCR